MQHSLAYGDCQHEAACGNSQPKVQKNVSSNDCARVDGLRLDHRSQYVPRAPYNAHDGHKHEGLILGHACRRS